MLIFIFSFTPVFTKLAGMQALLSVPFLLLYTVSVGILGIYAIVWQQIIKRLPLSEAYANRVVTMAWGVVWGVLFFVENISMQKWGAAVIIGGVMLFSLAQGEENG